METAPQKFRLMARFISENNYDEFNLLLPKLTDINFQTDFNNSALHDSLMYNRVEMARRLILKNANMHQTPIITSAIQTFSSMNLMHHQSFNHELILTMLTMSPACASVIHGKISEDQVMQNVFLESINESSHGQRNDMMKIAVAYGNLHFVDVMMRNGDEAIFRRLEMGITPLMWSMMNFYEIFNVSGKVEFSIEDILSGILLKKIIAKISERLSILKKEDFDDIKTIITKYPFLLWDRYNEKHFGNRYTTREATGKTSMAILMETIIKIRKIQLKNQIMVTDAEFQVIGNITTNIIETANVHKDLMFRNLYTVENEFGLWMWNQMLQELRLAMGMAKHDRLGSLNKCEIKMLGNDEMDFIFKELISSISWDEKLYMVS